MSAWQVQVNSAGCPHTAHWLLPGLFIAMAVSEGRPRHTAFLTHLDDSSDDVEIGAETENTLDALRREQEDLQTAVNQARQKLAATKVRVHSLTAFVPLAPIFPLKRDTFTEGRSAEKHLAIYQKEWHRIHKRFQRTSDTDYPYSIEREIQRKAERLKELEQKHTELVVSSKSLERGLVWAKSESAANAEAANTTALITHVTMLRDQVQELEDAEAQNREMFKTSAAAMDKAERKYRKVKAAADELGISLISQQTGSMRAEYDALQKRLASLEKQGCYKEHLRIRELTREKRKLRDLEEQLRILFTDKESSLHQARLQLSEIQQENPGALRQGLLMSMSTAKLEQTAAQFYSDRMAETVGLKFEEKLRNGLEESRDHEQLS